MVPAARRPRRLVALAVVGAVACGGSPDGPVERVRALVAKAEAAATAKDLAALGDLVSMQYADDDGDDRRSVLRLAGYRLLQHRTIHLVTSVTRVRLDAPGVARAVVFAAMAGAAGASVRDLLLARADVYRFDLQVVREPDGEWRVRQARWRPAEAGDLRRLDEPAALRARR